MNRVAELARAVGAEPVLIDAAAHDRAMAYVSHAPQLVASALYAVAARNGVLGAAGPGFRDMTRIAGGPPSIWRDIFETNRHEIAAALTQLLSELAAPATLGNDEGLAAAVALLERAQAAKGHAARESEAKP
jgi:prephenate dehydrogenase